MANRIDSAFSDHDEKVQTLKELLSDPVIRLLAQCILSPKTNDAGSVNGVEVIQKQPERKPRRQRGAKRQHGALIRASAEIVKESMIPMSAKEVTQVLEKRNFQFEAEKKQVAVSKALRALARKGKIHSEKRGHGPKAPIIYSRGAALFSVQETTQ